MPQDTTTAETAVTNGKSTVDVVLADTAAHGFIFENDTVKRDGQSYANTPIMRLVDVAKFEAAFPGVILSTANGQSVRVSSQRIGRDLRYEKHAKDAEIQRANVEWLLGIRPSVSKIVYAGPEG